MDESLGINRAVCATGATELPIVIPERKLKANRENAKKSTGPKTIRGKAFSRQNAFKHGLFARGDIDFFCNRRVGKSMNACGINFAMITSQMGKPKS